MHTPLPSAKKRKQDHLAQAHDHKVEQILQRDPTLASGQIIQRSPADYGHHILQNYLKKLREEEKIEGGLFSDNKAHFIVDYWKQGNARYILSPKDKSLLMRELLTGTVYASEQQAVMDLVHGTFDFELYDLFQHVTPDDLKKKLSGKYKIQLGKFLALHGNAISRRKSGGKKVWDNDSMRVIGEKFHENTKKPKKPIDVSESDQRFRQNCINIIYRVAPTIFKIGGSRRFRNLMGKPPRVGTKKGWTMTTFGNRLRQLGLAGAPLKIRFNNKNGLGGMPTDFANVKPWDAIMQKVGSKQGWHIFGAALYNGFHSQAILVDKRPDRVFLYVADQWQTARDDDAHLAPGSIHGLRRYDEAGFNGHVLFYTRFWYEKYQFKPTLRLYEFNRHQ